MPPARAEGPKPEPRSVRRRAASRRPACAARERGRAERAARRAGRIKRHRRWPAFCAGRSAPYLVRECEFHDQPSIERERRSGPVLGDKRGGGYGARGAPCGRSLPAHMAAQRADVGVTSSGEGARSRIWMVYTARLPGVWGAPSRARPMISSMVARLRGLRGARKMSS